MKTSFVINNACDSMNCFYPGVTSSIPAGTYTIISKTILPLPWIQAWLLSVTIESMCTKYWLTAWSSLPRKKVWVGELTVPT